jgi:hypothetical protein
MVHPPRPDSKGMAIRDTTHTRLSLAEALAFRLCPYVDFMQFSHISSDWLSIYSKLPRVNVSHAAYQRGTTRTKL